MLQTRVMVLHNSPRMLNKEVVKRKEKRDCEEGRINELSLGYSFPLGVPDAGSHLGAPAPLPVAPAVHWSKRDWALLNSQLVLGSWGKGFSCSCKLNSSTAYGAAFVSLDHLQRLKPAGFTLREKVHGETGKHFHMGYAARRMLNSGSLIKVREKMTSHGHEELVLFMVMNKFVNMLDSWKKVLLFSSYVFKCHSWPLDGCGVPSDTRAIKSPATLLLIDSHDKGSGLR